MFVPFSVLVFGTIEKSMSDFGRCPFSDKKWSSASYYFDSERFCSCERRS